MSLYVESCSQNWKYKQKNINFQLEPSQAYGGSSGESFLRNFINWCMNKEVPLATGFDAVKTAQIIDAAYQSSVKGKKININPYDAK
jgi:predicted dehydrogenase